jgi:hypothetical protein
MEISRNFQNVPEDFSQKRKNLITNPIYTGWEKIMGNTFSQQHFSKYRSATLSEYFIRTLKVIINIK